MATPQTRLINDLPSAYECTLLNDEKWLTNNTHHEIEPVEFVSKVGEIFISRRELTDIFGQPLPPNHEPKVNWEWHLAFEHTANPNKREYVVIYDYKKPLLYRTGEQMWWSIGAKNSCAAMYVWNHLMHEGLRVNIAETSKAGRITNIRLTHDLSL